MNARIIIIFFFPIFAIAQAPQKINFQSILRNTNGEVVANKSVSLKISILSGSISGSSVYGETHAKTTDASGLISLQIGNGTVLSGIFANIDWGGASHFIKLEADFNGGSNYVVLGTQELMSVPYALYATKTDTSTLNLTSRLATKLNATDTASLSYRIDLKLTKTDTTSMLSTYLRKTDAIITDLQNQVALLSSYTSLLASGLVDIDGNNYPVVKIGNQIWMKENLRVSRYRNGGQIPNVTTDNTGWGNLSTGAWSYYNNDVSNNSIYGKLYNWYTTKGDTLCPTGWHVPTDAEWTTLTNYLGGEGVAGGKMKATGTAYWNDPNTGAINSSGFSALPGGVRGSDGSFNYIIYFALFWSATESANDNAWLRNLFDSSGDVSRGVIGKSVGASVRCLRD
jgi:uncharacterized protein (TIGR02145 family)